MAVRRQKQGHVYHKHTCAMPHLVDFNLSTAGFMHNVAISLGKKASYHVIFVCTEPNAHRYKYKYRYKYVQVRTSTNTRSSDLHISYSRLE